MTISESIKLMKKEINCTDYFNNTDPIHCHQSCKDCENYMTVEEDIEMKRTALHVMQAWQRLKGELRKKCGCTLALDIMKYYEKEIENMPEPKEEGKA